MKFPIAGAIGFAGNSLCKMLLQQVRPTGQVAHQLDTSSVNFDAAAAGAQLCRVAWVDAGVAAARGPSNVFSAKNRAA